MFHSLSATPDHLACLFKVPLCWHQQLNLDVKAVLTQPSRLTSGADGEAASSSTPRDVRERRLRGNHSSVTGRWLSKQDRSWLVYWPSHPPQLGNYSFSPQQCWLVLSIMPCYTSELYCLLSCHCLSGSLERYAGRWVGLLNFSLQGGLLQSFKLSVSCHVMLMLPGKSVISVFCRYVVSAVNFKTFSRIDRADSIWLPVLQAFFSCLLLILQWIFGL